MAKWQNHAPTQGTPQTWTSTNYYQILNLLYDVVISRSHAQRTDFTFKIDTLANGQIRLRLF